MKTALITGITGQDGSYLAELLLEKGYSVHGLVRSVSVPNTKRIDHIKNDLHIHHGDMTDTFCLDQLVEQVHPWEVYNLAALSHVGLSFSTPEYTAQVDALGTLRILEAVRRNSRQYTCKVYQASTSELFGGINMPAGGYNEKSPFHPRSPYGVAKQYAFWIAKNYRESYNMFVCNGILFNHESPRRTETFVTKKIVEWCKRFDPTEAFIPLQLGNLDTKRDWGHSIDYVRSMWMILQHDKPDDWVVATGKTYSVRTFVEKCFAYIGRPIEWDKASNGQESGFWENQVVVQQNPEFFRPADVDVLKGDSSKITRELGWMPSYDLDALISDMFEVDF